VLDFELGGDNTTKAVAMYCYSQHMSCPGEQCVFELHGVMAHDRSTEPHCEAETLEGSFLHAALIGADIAELLKGEASFLADWIQSNKEEYYNTTSLSVAVRIRRCFAPKYSITFLSSTPQASFRCRFRLSRTRGSNLKTTNPRTGTHNMSYHYSLIICEIS
jgi:hypothetical protein